MAKGKTLENELQNMTLVRNHSLNQELLRFTSTQFMKEKDLSQESQLLYTYLVREIKSQIGH